MSTSDFSWDKGGRVEDLLVVTKVKKSGALSYPEPLGPPRPVAEHLYFIIITTTTTSSSKFGGHGRHTESLPTHPIAWA